MCRPWASGLVDAANTVADTLLRFEDDADRAFASFDGGLELSRGQMLQRASALAGTLLDAGLAPGDRVLMMLDNGPEFLDAWFACALAGMAMVPLNTRLRGPLLADVVRRSGTRAVVAHAGYAELVDEVHDGVVFRAVVDGQVRGWAAHEEVVATAAAPARVRIRGSDPLSIIFTSGTTGPAKGVILSHEHCVARARAYVRGLRLRVGDVMFTCLPLFHNNAQMATVLPAMLTGARAAIRGRFSVSAFWPMVREAGATRFTIIGRMANQLLAAPPQDADRDNLVRSCCIVPAPRGGDAFAERFGVRVVSQYYGSTEMIPMPPDLDQDLRPGSCGRPGPEYECAVMGPDGALLPDGEVGELVARPRHPSGVMTGYLDMAEATLHAFRGLWFHTGDAVRRDTDGFYHLVGRLNEFIRHKGENISATEVEDVVRDHPGVADAAVVGVPDEWGEELVVLYAEPVGGTALDGGALQRFCVDRLPDFMVPARVHVIASLPRNSLGRVEKFKLEEAGRHEDL